MPRVTLPPLVLAIAVCGALVGLSAQETPVFRSTADIVNITTTVTDKAGRAVSNLSADDFEVYEDGQLQTLSSFIDKPVPVSMGLLIDVSASVFWESNDSLIRSAVSRLIASPGLRSEAEFFVLEFYRGMRNLTQPWTTDRDAIDRAMLALQRYERLGVPLGLATTGLADAVAVTMPIVSVGRHSKRVLVVFSSGGLDESSVSRTVLRRILRESDLIVYGVTIPTAPPPAPQCQPPACNATAYRAVMEANTTGLEQITAESGGWAESADNPATIARLLDKLSSELSGQYLLAYQRAAPPDGVWHDIRVTVRDSSFIVRARQGYVAR